jgi:GNAT superfamily N-acetyltransferase
VRRIATKGGDPLTDDVRLLPLTPQDESLVDAIYDRLTTYSMLAEGLAKATNAAREFLIGLPQGWPPSSKHVFAVLKDERPVGLVDLIDGYPAEGIVFVGLLAIAEDRHGEGIGRATQRLIEEFAHGLGAAKLRLAVVEGNPAHSFWLEMGYTETGERKPHAGEAKMTMVRLMEKPIPPLQNRSR